MNKELTPLKAHKELKSRYGKYFSLQDDERAKVIETTLKDYEELKQINIDRSKQLLELVSEQTENSKKLKALEIIKNKRVDVWLILHVIDNSDNVEDYNAINKRPIGGNLTQEEYDLLKEVLL